MGWRKMAAPLRGGTVVELASAAFQLLTESAAFGPGSVRHLFSTHSPPLGQAGLPLFGMSAAVSSPEPPGSVYWAALAPSLAYLTRLL